MRSAVSFLTLMCISFSALAKNQVVIRTPDDCRVVIVGDTGIGKMVATALTKNGYDIYEVSPDKGDYLLASAFSTIEQNSLNGVKSCAVHVKIDFVNQHRRVGDSRSNPKIFDQTTITEFSRFTGCRRGAHELIKLLPKCNQSN